MIEANAGRPYGHVPGHRYLDAELTAEKNGSRWVATILITWGSAQGRNEEHGREEYTRFGATADDAIEAVRDVALAEQEGESRRYVELACSRALTREMA